MFTTHVLSLSYLMKILILVDNLGSGGMQAQLVNLVNEIKKRGHEIQLVLYHPEMIKDSFVMH